MAEQSPQPAADDAPPIGILITNLGTPDAPTPAALRRYLKEFLWDPRVVELPRWLWWPILNGLVLRLRPARSAHAYNQIWTNEGSPLLVNSRAQHAALSAVLQDRLGGRAAVALGMRYGSPSIADALNALKARGVQRLLVLPLYPQYSASTTASTFDKVTQILKVWRRLPEVRFITHYFDNPAYIQAVADSIREHSEQYGRADRLLFSFHGMPKSTMEAGDPYYDQCIKTADLIVRRLGLGGGQWYVTFQSRFGYAEWLRPYTMDTLKEWGQAGVKGVDVICPGFSADCLETLEEIAMQNREAFLAAGGERYHYIPALNDRPDHIRALAGIILQHVNSWLDTSAPDDAVHAASGRGAGADQSSTA